MVKELQKKVRELFEDKKVDMVVGWGKGSVPMSATPLFIKSIDEVDDLIFDETCQNNLAVYFTKDKRKLSKDGKKVGVIVKGCDDRSLVLYSIEKQIKRDDIVIIGVPCDGVIDKNKILRKTNNREVIEYNCDEKKVKVKGRDFELTLDKKDVLSDSCLTCSYPDAQVYDEFIGKARKKVDCKDEFKKVDDFEKLSLDERWNAITEEYSKCIRCYACRNVCPSCYCTKCFVDTNKPQWIGKSPEITDSIIFHLIRNLHVAGRCVECGACARACPVGIDLLLLNKKITKEINQRFDYTAGLDIDEKPVMTTYCENEKQDFIMG
ncbi:MAG: 4Fe-4S dicluster domain-containing protein [Candidatus Marinimicrobia bacterium]|nr:4Fe-4S dicluster domain-containing protein [Candidatus Neomarinimicrobiota bacterium]